MTVEHRLSEALHAVDSMEASPDLYARVERSLAEDQTFRRRRMRIIAASLAGILGLIAWVALGLDSAEDGGGSSTSAWRIVLVDIVVSSAIVLSLAPHIRRFARSFVDDVFYLSRDAGGRFLRTLDAAYYILFAGLILVDADNWDLTAQAELVPQLEALAFRIGFILLALGVLHAANIAFLPVLGLVFNSIVRRDLRRLAGETAPAESVKARTADRNARSFAIGLLVVVLSAVATMIFGPIGALFSGLVQ